jgi:thiamine pyrophosphate-dependent acetolactate synthase large subunit-like protein
MSVSLAVVGAEARTNTQSETVAQRVRRLQNEAKTLARDHISELTAMIEQAQRIASEIAVGGEAYPAGVRDLARRFSEDTDNQVHTIKLLAGRNS